jgi:hypothetical protein
MLKTRFDAEKALEAILYVASKAPIPDIYHVGKILWFADRVHLELRIVNCIPIQG